jgi:hypothetical protein
VVLPTASRVLNRYGIDQLLADAIVKKMPSESDSYPRPVNGCHDLQKRCQIYHDRRPLLHAGAQVAP